MKKKLSVEKKVLKLSELNLPTIEKITNLEFIFINFI